MDVFEKLSNSFQRKAEALNVLISDVEAMQQGIAKNKPFSRRSLEPMTRLRNSKEELDKAKANPNEQFIEDKINDIFGDL